MKKSNRLTNGIRNLSLKSKNNSCSPASAFNTLATGLGRITQGKIGISPDRSFDYAPPESFTLIPCRPSLTTQNSGDRSSAASHYGGASSTSFSYDLPGWCAAVLSVLHLPKPAGNNSTTSRNETATEEAGGLIGRDERVLGLSLAYPSACPLTALAQADHQLCCRASRSLPQQFETFALRSAPAATGDLVHDGR
ncbi:hypothetical protein PtA15_4A653 [Puccinia triticina]|uniref:Uncharacterized protein n=1 Tax=Puccinia triticina TaxID=208348 RepID=A0ABY7CG46_9BASI|nr:uncharacterized protein PtA15_4A653 [Puccinia triticina]WAQ84201.1 hypothetical protein PtA15_4A653 [Puccinia triticina]WAR55028.1 hypothetical protein PtB15_4B647 [Puccinia triticina]